MNSYVTGSVIRKLREEKKITQEELAQKLFVSSKAVSKWETGKGLPDITLLEPLAKALNISVTELLNGEDIRNYNKAANINKSVFYVCPICKNVIWATGKAVISCCGITLPPLIPEEADGSHIIHLESIEDEYYFSLSHPMTKEHYISFIAAVSDCGVQLLKLYPEENAQGRFKKSRIKYFYAYCNKHGLYRINA